MLETRCGSREAYQEALATGQGATTMEPEGAAAREVRALYNELFGAPARRSARRS